MLVRRTDIPFYRKKLGFLWGDVCIVPVRPDWVAVVTETIDLVPECVDRLIRRSADLGVSSIFFESHHDYGLSELRDLPDKPINLQPQLHEPNQMLEFKIEGLHSMGESEKAVIRELFTLCNGLIVTDTEQIAILVTHDDVTLILGQQEIVEGVCGLSIERGFSWLAEFAKYIGDNKFLPNLYKNLRKYPNGFSGRFANLCEGIS
ncbi:hypothetical protein [Calidithermus chliarophilus]|uniref:hypothetical protein n=1 Tax=Calidithermus chliarophilus TaxID=52023 RepID=UPI0012F6607B|nr:hypothetical protein [Calidithermus chliarophilus]